MAIYQSDIHPVDPREVSEKNFPRSGSGREKLLFLLSYAVLAPSILNAQPWRFRVSDDAISVFADRSRLLSVVDPVGRELTISCGAALFNLRIAVRSFGYDCEMEIPRSSEEPDLLAEVRVRPGPEPTDFDRQMRDAILRRGTVRSRFDDKPLPGDLLKKLAEAARVEGSECTCAHETEHKQRVGALVAEAERIHLSDAAFREELQSWLAQRRTEDHEAIREAYSRMGVPAGHTPESREHRDRFILTATSTARQFANAASTAASRRAMAEASPALALLTTAQDTSANWLAAGQAMQRVLLLATNAGASASYLNPPIEIARLRPRLAEIFGIEGHPQVLLRLGYAGAISRTPRRPLDEVTFSIS